MWHSMRPMKRWTSRCVQKEINDHGHALSNSDEPFSLVVTYLFFEKKIRTKPIMKIEEFKTLRGNTKKYRKHSKI